MEVVQQHPSAAAFPGGESMRAMQTRAVEAVREWNARVEREHGADAVYLMCSHGDIIKSLVADALGIHLDLFQRISVDPCSVTAIRYTRAAAVPRAARRHRRLRVPGAARGGPPARATPTVGGGAGAP